MLKRCARGVARSSPRPATPTLTPTARSEKGRTRRLRWLIGSRSTPEASGRAEVENSFVGSGEETNETGVSWAKTGVENAALPSATARAHMGRRKEAR